MLTCLAQAVVTVNRAQEGMVDNNCLEVVGVNMDSIKKVISKSYSFFNLARSV